MSQIFHEWVAAYRDDAWSLASYLLKDPAEAEDVTQEAFIKLWNQRESVPRERTKPWLLRVVRNACLDRLRHLQLVTDVDDVQVPSPEMLTEQREVGRWLQEAIADLKEPQRSLVVLRDVQQMSYAEVATITGLSLDQVKVYLHRARKELRERLAEIKP